MCIMYTYCIHSNIDIFFLKRCYIPNWFNTGHSIDAGNDDDATLVMIVCKEQTKLDYLFKKTMKIVLNSGTILQQL